MKRLLFILSILLVIGCSDTNVKYSSSIETYVISEKQFKQSYGRGVTYNQYLMWFQTSTKTECTEVDYNTFNKYNKGDTITVLIKTITKTKD